MKRISLFICFLLFSQAAWAAETIKIGFMGPLSGDFVAVGIEAKQVVELLARDTNDRGGILGRKVEVICEDDGGETPDGRSSRKETRPAGCRCGHRLLYIVNHRIRAESI